MHWQEFKISIQVASALEIHHISVHITTSKIEATRHKYSRYLVQMRIAIKDSFSDRMWESRVSNDRKIPANVNHVNPSVLPLEVKKVPFFPRTLWSHVNLHNFSQPCRTAPFFRGHCCWSRSTLNWSWYSHPAIDIGWALGSLEHRPALLPHFRKPV